MNKNIKMMVLVAVGAVALLAQVESTVAAPTSNIGNNSSLAQILVKPPAYKITYAKTSEIVEDGEMMFVWVRRGEEFKGLNLDGTAVDTNTVVLERFPIKNGTFRAFTVAWPRERWDQKLGDIRLLLLDTRLISADVAQKEASSTNSSYLVNQGMAIQAYGTAGYYSYNGTGITPTQDASGEEIAPWADIPGYEPTDLPDNTPVPVMIDINNSKATTSDSASSGYVWENKDYCSYTTNYTIYTPTVTIKVTNTVSTLNYVVQRSTDASFTDESKIETLTSSKKVGASDQDTVLTFTVSAPQYYTYSYTKTYWRGNSTTSDTFGPYSYDSTKETTTKKWGQTTTNRTKCYTGTSVSSTYFYRVTRYIETPNEDGTTTEELDDDKGGSNIMEASLTDETSSSSSSSSSSGSSILDKIFGF